jgi:transcriptional regulator with XRE-family HTH domain
VDRQQVSTDFNKRVGENIQRLRKTKGMSQADLARALTARGFPFQQQGVLKLEGGTRPLRLEEALAIAEIFDAPPGLLLDAPANAATATVQLMQVMADITETKQRIADHERNLKDLEAVKADIERRLEEMGATQGPHGQWWWFEGTDGEH